MNNSSSDLLHPLNPSNNSKSEKSSPISGMSSETYQFIKDLMRVNYLKIIFFGVPFAFTFIGLLLLYQFKQLRALIIFSGIDHSQIHKSSHVMVKSSS